MTRIYQDNKVFGKVASSQNSTSNFTDLKATRCSLAQCLDTTAHERRVSQAGERAQWFREHPALTASQSSIPDARVRVRQGKHMYICLLGMSVCAHVCRCAHPWRPDPDIQMFSSNASPGLVLLFVLRQGLCMDLQLTAVARLAIKSLGVFTPEHLGYRCIPHACLFSFYVGAGNLNPDLHAYTASTLCDDPSPQPITLSPFGAPV